MNETAHTPGLTKAQLWLLTICPVLGLAPGSNIWPLVDIEDDGNTVNGEEIDELLRAGFLSAEPLSEPKFVQPGGGDIPDLEATHRLHLTHAGRAAISKATPPEGTR